MKHHISSISHKIFYCFAVLIFVFFMLGPILWSFSMSITPQREMGANTTKILPSSPTLANYTRLLFSNTPEKRLFIQGILNSLWASGLSLALGIPIAFFCAYALSRVQFRGKKIIKNVLLMTMAIPVFATIIPLYKIFITLGLLDNIFALTLVYITSFLPVSVWIISSYLDTLPKELEEAAMIDGSHWLRTLFQIILPLSYPILFATSLIIFLTTWNQFQIPLILATSNQTKPTAVVISEFVTKNTVNYGLMNAGGILAIVLPVICAVVFRKFLVEGMASGSTKG